MCSSFNREASFCHGALSLTGNAFHCLPITVEISLLLRPTFFGSSRASFRCVCVQRKKAFVGRLGDSIGFMCACSNETSVVVDAIGSGTGSGSCSSAVTTFVADVDNFRLLEGGEDGGVGRDTGLTPTGKVLLGLFRSSGFCINPNFATLS